MRWLRDRVDSAMIVTAVIIVVVIGIIWSGQIGFKRYLLPNIYFSDKNTNQSDIMNELDSYNNWFSVDRDDKFAFPVIDIDMDMSDKSFNNLKDYLEGLYDKDDYEIIHDEVVNGKSTAVRLFMVYVPNEDVNNVLSKLQLLKHKRFALKFDRNDRLHTKSSDYDTLMSDIHSKQLDKERLEEEMLSSANKDTYLLVISDIDKELENKYKEKERLENISGKTLLTVSILEIK